MSRTRLPRITDTWTRSGWVIESSHIPGSYRMLTIWGISLVQIPWTVHTFGPGVSALATVAGLVSGAGVYLHLSRDVPASGERWTLDDTQAQSWPSVDRPPLTRPAVNAGLSREPASVNTGTERAA